MNKTRTILLGGMVTIGIIGIVWLRNHQTRSNVPPDQLIKKIAVVTSFYPLYYFASEIGKDNIHIVNVTPAGAEPHDYEPTSGDIARIERANLLILNGVVEPWGDKMIENVKGKPVTVVVVGRDVITDQTSDEHGQSGRDPHVWLSPLLASIEVEKILRGFLTVDPGNAAVYQAHAKTLQASLDGLDMEYRNGLASCSQKDIITSHAAFGYLASAYGLRQLSISGLSPDAEPSARQLADIAQFAKIHSIHYIFFESLVSPKLAETIATSVGAKTLVLNPLEGLTDEEQTQGKTYLTEMETNLKNLQLALSCR